MKKLEDNSSRKATKLLGEDSVILKPPDDDATTLKTALNTVGYSVSLVVSYLAGLAGWFSGGVPNNEIAAAYQTLITPNTTLVSYTWGVIFLLEGFFVIFQLFRSYREDPLVRGISYQYFSACLMQAIWGVTFGLEKMVYASIAMSVMLFFLLWVVKAQWSVVDKQRRTIERSAMGHAIEKDAIRTAKDSEARHPLLRLPFSIHAAWICTSTPWMVCVALLAIDADAKYEMWVSALCEALLVGACLGLLLRNGTSGPTYSMPLVCAFNFLSIAWELHAPTDSILARFDASSVTLMKNMTAFCGASIILICLLRAAIMYIIGRCFNKKSDDKGEAEYRACEV